MSQTILIVEDEPAIAALMREILNEQPGYWVKSVPDCARALRVLQEVVVDLLVLDLILPGMSGLAFYDYLQLDPRWSGIPVLFVTASPQHPQFAVRRFRNVLAKPFTLEAFVKAVTAILRPPLLDSATAFYDPQIH